MPDRQGTTTKNPTAQPQEIPIAVPHRKIDLAETAGSAVGQATMDSL
ncbi:hypothetical protein [Actinokineospora cianjurensis]|nr:hypothetical protein [Actinokineospora cianjurensis]